MKNVKILVATHKKYKMPDDLYYVPVHAGKKGKPDLGYIGDNIGDNISDRNLYYSELTCMYWAWKNICADYIGLSHYRRHFSNGKSNNDPFDNILLSNEIDRLLEKSDVILPKKRNYYIETLYSHYKNTMYIETLDETGKIIEEMYPEYSKYFTKLSKRRSAHMFNMFIMKKEYFDKYCQWLFSILFELEKRIDYHKYDSFHGRFFGRVSELMLDIWIEKNNINYIEVPVISMEKVNWFYKGGMFLISKLTGKRYKKSF